MKAQKFALIFAAALTPAQLQAGPAGTVPGVAMIQGAQDDITLIKQVMGSFDAAIKAKDVAALRALFYEGKIVWRATGHPQSRAEIGRLESRTVPIVEDIGAHQLIVNPELAAFRLEEVLGEPTIRTDGQLATVTFSYRFLAQGQIQNWGEESWQMAKAADGWKIVHLMFSYHLEQLNPYTGDNK